MSKKCCHGIGENAMTKLFVGLCLVVAGLLLLTGAADLVLGLVGGLLGIVVGLVGGLAGLLAGVLGAVFGLLVTLLVVLSPLIILVLAVVGLCKLVQAA